MDRGAKDMSVLKRKHFVELKVVGETGSYLNDDRNPFKRVTCNMACSQSARVRPPYPSYFIICVYTCLYEFEK